METVVAPGVAVIVVLPAHVVLAAGLEASTYTLLPEPKGAVTETLLNAASPTLFTVTVTREEPCKLVVVGENAALPVTAVVTASVAVLDVLLVWPSVVEIFPAAIVLAKEPTVLPVTLTLTVQLALADTVNPLTANEVVPATAV